MGSIDLHVPLTRKGFTEGQIEFMVALAVNSAIDRIQSMLPPAMDLQAFRHDTRNIQSNCHSCMQVAGMNLATLYYQLTDDECKIHEAIAAVKLDLFVEGLLKDPTTLKEEDFEYPYLSALMRFAHAIYYKEEP
jgi:hypothetical protein